MTAEIAILNKEAVALAADSAVTVQGHNSQKIWNCANKVFALSKFEPVGVMIYGGAEFCGIPWETIIKWYREDRHSKHFPSLPNYFDDFCSFIEENEVLFPPGLRANTAATELSVILQVIVEEVDARVETHLSKNESIQPDSLSNMVADLMGLWENRLNQAPTWEDVDQAAVDAAHQELISTEQSIKDTIFQDLPLPVDFSDRFRRISRLMLQKLSQRQGLSGIVIAGFGRDDVFPRLREFSPDFFVGKRLKRHRSAPTDITAQSTAVVQAFAQSDMTQVFMDGIEPTLQTAIDEYVRGLAAEIPDLILDGMKGIDLSNMPGFADKLRKAMASIPSRFAQEWGIFKHRQITQPIVSTIQYLPKEELAAVAETLVNITSFRRRVSQSAETVGGPIDVAVISKGDGLVWIKRKHYFEPRLNQHFFANYLVDRRTSP